MFDSEKRCNSFSYYVIPVITSVLCGKVNIEQKTLKEVVQKTLKEVVQLRKVSYLAVLDLVTRRSVKQTRLEGTEDTTPHNTKEYMRVNKSIGFFILSMILRTLFRGESRTSAVSKIKFFVTYVNCWKLLTNVTKSSNLATAGVLDTPLLNLCQPCNRDLF